MSLKDNQIRYSEIFRSCQGEGQFIGVPSVFFRTFGCNFRCKSFGRPQDENLGRYNPEVEELINQGVHKSVEQFEDLPLVHTGCDTYASIYPEFKHLNKLQTVDEISEVLVNHTPNKCWTQEDGQDIHLIMTGGEPLLAWQDLYADLFSEPLMSDLKNVTFETNTTQPLRPKLKEYLFNRPDLTVTWSCSPKLSPSGEPWDKAIKPDIAAEYLSVPGSSLYLKFVVAQESDLAEVERATALYQQAAGQAIPIYLMPVGGRTDEYFLNETQVANMALERGWRFSPRLQISLYGNEWGT